MNIDNKNEMVLRRLNRAVDRFCLERGQNRQAISDDTGIKYSTLSAILSGKGFEDGKPGPGTFILQRLTSHVGTTLDELFTEPSTLPQISTSQKEVAEPLSDDFKQTIEASWLTHITPARCFQAGGGRREWFQSIIEYSDEYEIPRDGDTSLRLIRMGLKSLSTLTLGKHDPELFQRALITVGDMELKARWMWEYRHAVERGEFHRADAMDARAPNMEKAVKIKFFKSLYLVNKASKNASILNFSTPLINPRDAPST